DRTRIARPILASFRDRRGDRLGQIRVRRPFVRAAGSGRVIAVLARRRGPGVEILRTREGLADQLGAHDTASARDEGAVGLLSPEELPERVDDGRVDPAEQNRENNDIERRAEYEFHQSAAPCLFEKPVPSLPPRRSPPFVIPRSEVTPVIPRSDPTRNLLRVEAATRADPSLRSGGHESEGARDDREG